MTCKEVIRRLSEYLDGELDPEIEAGLTKHLEHCEDCGLVVDTTRKTIQIYCNAEPAPLPEGMHDRLMTALSQKLGRGPADPGDSADRRKQ